jgi:hypothetical protein
MMSRGVITLPYELQHSVNGPPPYQVLGRIVQGQSFACPKRGDHGVPNHTKWKRVTPIVPCGDLTWGIGTSPDGDNVPAFSPRTKTKADALLAVAVLQWMFHKVDGAFLFSIETTVNASVPYLNIGCSTDADQGGLDALLAEFAALAPGSEEAWLLTVVERAQA